MEENTLILPTVMSFLQEYAAEVERVYKESLTDSDHIASRDLYNSISTTVEVDGQAYYVRMTLEDYWKYIEEGTRPHWPPPSALLRWIEVKPVIPRPDGRGRIPTPQQLAYLIGRKIAREGTEGTHDLARTVEEVNLQFEQRLQDALAQDCAESAHAWLLEFLAR